MKKQLALASAILGLLVSFGTSTISNAAFELNEEIKNSLKKALLILMNEMEYEKINITLLCNKAGVSMTDFYNNFQNKK